MVIKQTPRLETDVLKRCSGMLSISNPLSAHVVLSILCKYQQSCLLMLFCLSYGRDTGYAALLSSPAFADTYPGPGTGCALVSGGVKETLHASKELCCAHDSGVGLHTAAVPGHHSSVTVLMLKTPIFSFFNLPSLWVGSCRNHLSGQSASLGLRPLPSRLQVAPVCEGGLLAQRYCS